MALTLAEANQVVEGALAKARELNIKISVAVCDAGGRLVAFNRMDGAIWGGAYGSQGKAMTSVGFARPSGELQERADVPIIRGIIAAEGGHMILTRVRCRSCETALPSAPVGWAAAPRSKTKTAPEPASSACNAIASDGVWYLR